jgi:hypothetical protein
MINNTQVSAVIRFATREEGVSFSSHPDKINVQLYVHENGDIDRLGVSIAKSLTNCENKMGITCEIDNLDGDYFLGYDIDYIYYVWQAKGKSTWISIFKPYIESHEACPTCGSKHYGEPVYKDKCIFVGIPDELLDKLDA